MNSYIIGAARHEGGKLVEVAIQCTDEPEGPYLYECDEVSVSEVIERLKQGDTLVTVWSLPGGASGSIPVELLTLPDGEESIEVVQRGQPEGYRCVTWSDIEALVATENASISRHGNEVVMRYAINTRPQSRSSTLHL